MSAAVARPKGYDVLDWLAEGGTPAQLTELAAAAPEWTPADEDPAPPAALPAIINAAELLRLELRDPDFIVPGKLPEGLTILGGKPKLGKSWLMLQLALAVALRGVVLGERVEDGDVLYLALEDNLRRMQGRIRKQLAGTGAIPERLTIATAWSRLDAGGLGDIAAWLREHPGARLVIIDTLAKVRPRSTRNGNAYEDDYAAVEGLQMLAGEYGVAIVVVHHLRKLDSEDPIDTVSGTLGLTGGADGIWVLRRERGRADATLYTTGRDLDDEELALRFDAGSATWSALGEAEEYRRSMQRQQVIDLLREVGEALPPSEVADRLGLDRNTVKQRLFQMHRAGELANDGGKYRVVTDNR